MPVVHGGISMSQFTSPLLVEFTGGERWYLIEGFEYHVGCYPSKEIIVVPAGFDTDFASIPRVFWPILPPTGLYGKSAVVHDYTYRHAPYSRKKCDEIFLEGLEVLKVSRWKCFLIYWAVRLFGWYAWRRRRRLQLERG